MDLVISDTRGGLNNSDPPIAIGPDQVTEAYNIEWVRSPVGARRRGATAISVAGSVIPTYEMVTFLHRHTGGASFSDDTLWALGVSGSSSSLVYKDTSWHTATLADTVDVTGVYKYRVKGQSLHGKLFLAYKSDEDRLHVWDGTTVRRAGIIEPSAAPTAADTGAAGTFSGTRYYRVRFTRQVSSVTVLRSEPSEVLTKVPSGVNTGLVVTKPSNPGDSETHWELEASLDNTDFYRIATTAIGTGTATDTTAFTTGYAAAGILSEDIGDYTLIGSARFLTADQDRLIWAGSFEDEDLASVVGWTVVNSDTTGVGNDERVPLDTDNTLNLDGLFGGGLTGLSSPANGYIYAFKLGHIYKLVRTGDRQDAYEAVLMTDKFGAIEGSVVEGVDQNGKPCVYFVDPRVGPMRLGTGGLLHMGKDIIRTWKSVNIDANLPCVSLYYPQNNQLNWWWAVNETTPDTHMVLHTENTREVPGGVRGGWAIWTGPSRYVLAATLYAQNIDDDTGRSKVLAPFVSIGIGD